MVKKIIGLSMVVISIILIIIFITKGLIFPHLFAPVAIGVIGGIVLVSGKKEKTI
ncbi:MAG: hypothetical protein Q8920_02545 [Bacillota bacterium]|nr:hypothetical protein [Bacillota bacterium]